MKIIYLDHSGFQVETADFTMVFDYVKGTLPEVSKETRRIFFVSHKHEDHFSENIFTADREQDFYVLDRQLKNRVRRMALPETQMERVNFVRPLKHYELSCGGAVLSIETLPSTDCGVAFLVRDPEQPGKWIFHAGDLNWWFWEGEPKQWLNQMKAEYCRIVDSISEKDISAAFVPLDPRLEKNAAKGPAYFLEHVRTERMFPMHFWGRFGELEKLVKGPELEPYRDKIQMIDKAGEIILY